MKNTTNKTKIIIIAIITIIVILLVGFLVYRNKEKEGGVSSLFSNIFSILPSSKDTADVEAISGVTLQKDDPVYVSGFDQYGNPIVSLYTRDLSNFEEIYGYAISDFYIGKKGKFKYNNKYKYDFDEEEELVDIIDYKFECNDGIDNDNDGNIDIDDPNCHIDEDINKEYLPDYYSESYSLPSTDTDTPTTNIDFPNIDFPDTDNYRPNEFDGACKDGEDNDGDKFIDEEDPECHLDGDLDKEYLPDHYSEERYANSYIDLSAGNVTFQPIKTDEKTTFYSTISNYGTNRTQKGFSAFFSIKKVGEEVEDIYSETIEIPEISARGDFVTSISFAVKDTETYKIRACADKKNAGDVGEITEFNEDNNCGSWVNFKATTSIFPPDEDDKPECSDEKDNDNDGTIDKKDLNCHVGGTIEGEYLPDYDSESIESYECNDTIDNDGDGTIDEDDRACHEGGDLNKQYLQKYNSESLLSYECNDTVDNDGDGDIDQNDPECHEGGTLSGNYISTNDSESIAPAKPNVCLSLEPLEFTTEEKAKLDELLRKYYLIAPTLKSALDISLAYNEMLEYENFYEEIENLTTQCDEQVKVVKNTKYADMIVQYGNPWYHYKERGSYLKNIPKEKFVEEPKCIYDERYESSANAALTKDYSGDTAKEEYCNYRGQVGSELYCELYDSEDKNRNDANTIYSLVTGTDAVTMGLITLFQNIIKGEDKASTYWMTGCRWDNHDKTYLDQYEILFNVW